MDELPEKFEFIILGTGLPCSILSAALSRVGKAVLQVDRNEFYGSEWASFPPKQIEAWKENLASNGPIRNLKIHSGKEIPNQNRICLNLDNTPLFSSGEMIELLIQSKASRYLEFRNIGSLKTESESKLISVPASRADLFSSKRVTVLEKRKMMNFLTKAVLETDEEGTGTFDQFLDQFKLTAKLKHFICSSIIFSPPGSITCQEGVTLLRKFLKSLGRYSACSSFLTPLYGSGELSQAFSRMSAVFGGITILDYPPSSISITDNRIDHMLFRDKKIAADHVIGEGAYLTETLPFDQSEFFSQKLMIVEEAVWRAAVIDTEKVIDTPNSSTDDHCILSTISNGVLIWGTSLSSSSCTVPKDHVLISLRSTNQAELDAFVTRIPPADWSMSFDNFKLEFGSLPDNLTVSPTVSDRPGYDYAVKWARETFQKLCPEEEWMPAMPDPADIIIES